MWTNDVVLRLVDLFRSYECLWDTTNNDYKNKNKKRNSWEEISQKMNMPREVVETKIHNLRSQFIRERKKVHVLKKAAGGTEDVKQSNWFAYESLMFLLKGETITGVMDRLLESGTKQDSQSSNTAEFETGDDIVDPRRLENTHDGETAILENKSRKRTREDKINKSHKIIDVKRKMDKYVARDEFDIYAEYVASELRNIKSEEEVIMAKSFINDVLLEARLRSISQSATNSRLPHYDDGDDSTESSPDSAQHDENSRAKTSAHTEKARALITTLAQDGLAITDLLT